MSKRKRVLITGGVGFLGSHLCEYYVNKGWQVVAYDNLTKHELMRTGYDTMKARFYNYDFLKSIGVEIIQKDVRNYLHLLNACGSCDYIIHTAAQPAMTISIENPRLDYENNILGSFNVLEVARQLKIPAALCSTIHVYGPGINDEICELEDKFVRKPATIDENRRILTGDITPLH